jgi:hypothetical protein
MQCVYNGGLRSELILHFDFSSRGDAKSGATIKRFQVQ